MVGDSGYPWVGTGLRDLDDPPNCATDLLLEAGALRRFKTVAFEFDRRRVGKRVKRVVVRLGPISHRRMEKEDCEMRNAGCQM